MDLAVGRLHILQCMAQYPWTYGQHKQDSVDYKEKVKGHKVSRESGCETWRSEEEEWGANIIKYIVCMHKILKYLIKYYI